MGADGLWLALGVGLRFLLLESRIGRFVEAKPRRIRGRVGPKSAHQTGAHCWAQAGNDAGLLS
jgi:hypothetical protein